MIPDAEEHDRQFAGILARYRHNRTIQKMRDADGEAYVYRDGEKRHV